MRRWSLGKVNAIPSQLVIRRHSAKCGAKWLWSALRLLITTAALQSRSSMPPFAIEVRLNGGESGPAMIVQRDGSSDFYLPAATLQALRLLTVGLAATDVEGELHIRFADLKGLTLAFNAAAKRLELSIPAARFRAPRITFGTRDTGPMTLSEPVYSELRVSGSAIRSKPRLRSISRHGGNARRSCEPAWNARECSPWGNDPRPGPRFRCGAWR
jgi:hypothetical protein